MHDGLLTVGADQTGPPGPRRPHHRVLALAVTLAVVAAAALVSAGISGQLTGLIMTDVPLQPGDSGGPLVPANPASAGAGVAGITPGTPAAGVGLVPGDVITSIGGHAVTSAMSLRSVLDAYHPGDTASLHWVDQAGQEHAATIVFAAGPAG